MKKTVIILLCVLAITGGSCRETSKPSVTSNTASSEASVVNEPLINAAPEVQEDAIKEDTEEIVDKPISASAQLDVPFTSQAPHANWDLPYQEACEEASILMAARYLQARDIADAEDADSAILQLVNFGTEIGYPIDTTAAETADTLEQFYGLQTQLIEDFTIDDIKQAIANGNPVIIPFAGRQIGNPYYTSPGPLYHMMTIIGYTESTIITNDPGTKRGAEYSYSYDTILNAAHDWNNGNVDTGKKVMIIVSK